MPEPPLSLSVAVGAYPHTQALKSGRIASAALKLEFVEITPINRAFAPMVRERRLDVCEMAIATFLQAKAYGKQLVLLPIAMAARFQESALRIMRNPRLPEIGRNTSGGYGQPPCCLACIGDIGGANGR